MKNATYVTKTFSLASGWLCVCVRVCVSVCSNVIDLSVVSASGAAESASAAAATSHTVHDSTTPIYEHCGPPTSSTSPAAAAAAAERPVPRPRSTYGKYHLENLKNINAESKPANDDADWPIF